MLLEGKIAAKERIDTRRQKRWFWTWICYLLWA